MNINKALPPASPNHGVLKLKSRRGQQEIYISFSLLSLSNATSVMTENIKSRQTKLSACMIPSFNYCFYWFSGTICIPDSISMLTFQPRLYLSLVPISPAIMFPGFTKYFLSKPVGDLLLSSPPLHSPIVFFSILPDFYHKEAPNIPKKGEPMKAVKILMVLCKSDFRERKNSVSSEEGGKGRLACWDAKYENISIRADINI